MNLGMDGLDIGVQMEIDRGPKEAKSLKYCRTVLRNEFRGESSRMGPCSL